MVRGWPLRLRPAVDGRRRCEDYRQHTTGSPRWVAKLMLAGHQEPQGMADPPSRRLVDAEGLGQAHQGNALV